MPIFIELNPLVAKTWIYKTTSANSKISNTFNNTILLLKYATQYSYDSGVIILSNNDDESIVATVYPSQDQISCAESCRRDSAEEIAEQMHPDALLCRMDNLGVVFCRWLPE